MENKSQEVKSAIPSNGDLVGGSIVVGLFFILWFLLQAFSKWNNQ